MPSINEILNDESMNDGSFIRMYPEGVFYKAYERSAWLSCMHLGNLMVKKKHIKKVNQHIVSVGFPKTALEKWANGRKTDISEERVMIFLNEGERQPISEEFRIWKEHIKSKNESEKDGEYDILGDVYTKIRLFPLENKTPLDCMIFISELKNLINSNN